MTDTAPTIITPPASKLPGILDVGVPVVVGQRHQIPAGTRGAVVQMYPSGACLVGAAVEGGSTDDEYMEDAGPENLFVDCRTRLGLAALSLWWGDTVTYRIGIAAIRKHTTQDRFDVIRDSVLREHRLAPSDLALFCAVCVSAGELEIERRMALT